MSSSVRSTSAAAWRTGAGATDTSRSLTVESSRTVPMNWRITPSPPERVTAPSWGARSPAMIRPSVVLPVPLGPIRATLAPSPTRSETSLSSGLPSGRTKLTELMSRWPTEIKSARGRGVPSSRYRRSLSRSVPQKVNSSPSTQGAPFAPWEHGGTADLTRTSVLPQSRRAHLLARVAVVATLGTVGIVAANSAVAAPRLGPVASPAAVASAPRALWVWDTSDPQATVDLAVATGIGQLYAAVPPHVDSSS